MALCEDGLRETGHLGTALSDLLEQLGVLREIEYRISSPKTVYFDMRTQHVVPSLLEDVEYRI